MEENALLKQQVGPFDNNLPIYISLYEKKRTHLLFDEYIGYGNDKRQETGCIARVCQQFS